MKKIDEQKLRTYQAMHTARDFINSIENSNVVDDRALNLIKIKDAIVFLRNLKEKNEFEIMASENATVSAIKYLVEMEAYIKDCVITAHQKRDELSEQLQNARESSLKAFKTVIKPSFEKIQKALQEVQKMPLPRTHRKDAFSVIKDDMQAEYRKISDLIGQTYSR